MVDLALSCVSADGSELDTRTNVRTVKAPLSTEIAPITYRLLLLPHDEVDLGRLAPCAPLTGSQVCPVPIAMILPVNKDNDGKAIRNESLGLDVYGEWLRLVRNGDPRLDNPIAVASAIFCE